MKEPTKFESLDSGRRHGGSALLDIDSEGACSLGTGARDPLCYDPAPRRSLRAARRTSEETRNPMTRPSTLLLAAALLAALVAAVPNASAVISRPPEPGPSGKATTSSGPATKTFTFTYAAQYPQPPRDAQVIDVWIPLPTNDENQKVSDMVVQAPGGDIVSEPENGNSVFHFHSGPRGGVQINIHIKFKAERREIVFANLNARPAVPPEAPKNLDRYLKSDRLVPVDGETKTLASQITKGKKTEADKARAIFDYVTSTVRLDKSGEGWGKGDLRFALEKKRGNCADIGAAFTGLTRAAGIPARQIMGFKLPKSSGEGFISEYHCWTEFYLNGLGWVPADPADAAVRPDRKDNYFGRLDADRVQFSAGRDIVFEPRQMGDPISLWLYPYAEGDGVPWSGASYLFKWELIVPAAKPAG